MSFESLSTAAAIGTFTVIAATAIAAIVQLRHMRAGNQLTGLLNVLAHVEDPRFGEWVDAARQQIETDLPDPAYRRRLLEGNFERRNNAWLNLINSYEWVGSLIKHNLIPEETFMDVFSGRLLSVYDLVEEVFAIARRRGDPSIWENFEYLVVRARQWEAKHPHGCYPKNTPRLKISDKWVALDGPLSSQPA
ncbi:MAG: hypothetical protein M3T49_03515 [Candidatus Eremiobacteraeota bacterium]|nr:hypothetical protein [Candidatus Eremiobacteraeota bacterium]